MDRGAWRATVHGIAKESDTPYLTHTHTHTHTHTTTRIFLIKDISKQLAVVTPASLSVALHLL